MTRASSGKQEKQRLGTAVRYWIKSEEFGVAEKVIFAERPCLRGTAIHLNVRFLEMLPGMNTLTYFPAVLCYAASQINRTD